MYQEYEKYRTAQHKKRKEILPKITSPDMMDICETEWPADTSPVDMEEGVNDRKYDRNKKMMRKKRHNYQMALPLLILRKV